MKQFFGVLFGGLTAIGIGIGLAYAGSYGLRLIANHRIGATPVQKIDTDTVLVDPSATSISGIHRTIRYTATEEEDLINAAAQALPSTDSRITARAYILKNISRGETIIGRENDRLLPIASLTKLVTAVIARQRLDQDVRIIIGRKVMAAYGNTANFTPGEILTAKDLMYPLLMVSSNDAAEALALAYDRQKFIRAMNDWAQSIGAYRTYFADPSGLSAGNVSTANDMVLILDWIRIHDPEIIDITALRTKTVRSHTWVNPTHFLSWSYYIGGKNGYTTEANRTGATLFKLGKDKNIYAIVVLGSSNRDADVVKLLEKVRE